VVHLRLNDVDVAKMLGVKYHKWRAIKAWLNDAHLPATGRAQRRQRRLVAAPQVTSMATLVQHADLSLAQRAAALNM